MSKATTSVSGKYRLVGATYYRHCTAEFGFVGEGDSIVYRDCDGNLAWLYQADGKTVVTLLDLDADDLDLVPDLSFDRISTAARKHLLSLGYDADKLRGQYLLHSERLLAIAEQALQRIAACEDAPAIDAEGEWQKGMHCGVEDRMCHDAYTAADYGHTVGCERALEWASNEAKHALQEIAEMAEKKDL